MNFRHAVLASLIIFILLAPVCADENVNYLDETSKINFHGVDFMIPFGFGEAKSSQEFEDLGSNGQTCFYINEYGGEIIITVASDWMGMSLDELYKEGASKIEINGHEGWNYTKNNLTCFGYVEGNNAIIVEVTNHTRLNEVII